MSKGKFGKKLVIGAVEIQLMKMLCEKGACVGEELVGDVRKGSVYAMLARMVKKGWVTRDDEKRYRMAPRGLRAVQAWGLYHGG